MKITSDRLLAVYSGVTTAVLLAVLLSAGKSPHKANFDEITVQRINVVEPDGTLRLAISDRARFPGSPHKGKEFPRPDRTDDAGLLYMDDEGTEIGALTWNGKTTKEGKTSASSGFSFDRYNGDEQVKLTTYEENGKRSSKFRLSDSYSGPNADRDASAVRSLPKDRQEAAWDEWAKKYPSTTRYLVGRGEDNSVFQLMQDSQGRKRIVMEVAPDGTPSIQLFDEKGNVTSHLP